MQYIKYAWSCCVLTCWKIYTHKFLHRVYICCIMLFYWRRKCVTHFVCLVVPCYILMWFRMHVDVWIIKIELFCGTFGFSFAYSGGQKQSSSRSEHMHTHTHTHQIYLSHIYVFRNVIHHFATQIMQMTMKPMINTILYNRPRTVHDSNNNGSDTRAAWISPFWPK